MSNQNATHSLLQHIAEAGMSTAAPTSGCPAALPGAHATTQLTAAAAVVEVS